VEILRGGDLGRAPRHARRSRHRGLFALGLRFATAARGRWVAAVATIAACAAVVCLMLALASLLVRLRDDPGAVGKRYSLTVDLLPDAARSVAAIPGVAAAAPRYTVEAADSFRLGEPMRIVAYPGDHTRFEAPPLAEGRRVRGPGEAEVGLGLADALGLSPGSVLAAQLANGSEVRFRVVGIVRALEHDGRLAWTRPTRLLAADPGVSSSLAVRLDPGADPAAVRRRLERLGAPAAQVGGATTRNGDFLAVLATVLRGLGLAVGLVCLYALVQALVMTARERRGAVALLRACGGGARTVALVLGGATAAVAVPAAAAGLALEAFVLGPLVARLAAGYAPLPLRATAGQALAVAGGLLALGGLATAIVARRALREPIVTGLREE
jgi:ABC-type lipoprotein release transport system permease subunit